MACRRRSAGQGDQVGLPLVVQLAETVDLHPVLQHAVQTLVGVPPFDPVHGTFGHVQGHRHLGSIPTLVYLEQDTGPGSNAHRAFPAPDQTVQALSFFLGQLYRVSFPSHGCCTSPQPAVAVSVAV